MLLLEDPEWQSDIRTAIRDNSWNAPFAVKKISEDMGKLLEGLDNEYLRERSTDIRDISESLQREI